MPTVEVTPTAIKVTALVTLTLVPDSDQSGSDPYSTGVDPYSLADSAMLYLASAVSTLEYDNDEDPESRNSVVAGKVYELGDEPVGTVRFRIESVDL